MDAVSEILQPILIALAVLLIPACVKLGVNAIKKKMDEGRELAEARASKVEQLLINYQKETEAVAAQRHMDNVKRFDAIEIQTTKTNGMVAEHDKQITALAAQNELLIRLFPGPVQPPKEQ